MSETYPDGLAEFVRNYADDPNWTEPPAPRGRKSNVKTRAAKPANTSERESNNE